jgi:hypothetical protein
MIVPISWPFAMEHRHGVIERDVATANCFADVAFAHIFETGLGLWLVLDVDASIGAAEA